MNRSRRTAERRCSEGERAAWELRGPVGAAVPEGIGRGRSLPLRRWRREVPERAGGSSRGAQVPTAWRCGEVEPVPNGEPSSGISPIQASAADLARLARRSFPACIERPHHPARIGSQAAPPASISTERLPRRPPPHVLRPRLEVPRSEAELGSHAISAIGLGRSFPARPHRFIHERRQLL